MNLNDSFIGEKEEELAIKFINDGYVVLPVENHNLLNMIRDEVVRISMGFVNEKQNISEIDVLNNFHNYIDKSDLNAARLKVITKINANDWFKVAYYNLAKSALHMLVGNELVMQRRVNLSIQLPNDDSSLLKLHADTWSGDSAFEIVVWLPLVNCYKSKSMYILTSDGTKHLHENFSKYTNKSSEELYQIVKDDAEFIDIDYGSILLFNQTHPHGNRINQEIETRWSMNCRFKSIFTPYKDKKLGEFFQPITLKALSSLGMSYRLPLED